jgi:hypothetical protein
VPVACEKEMVQEKQQSSKAIGNRNMIEDTEVSQKKRNLSLQWPQVIFYSVILNESQYLTRRYLAHLTYIIGIDPKKCVIILSFY